MLSECYCCSLSEKSLSRCCCSHRCFLLTAQVQAQVLGLAQVQAQAQVLGLGLEQALLLGPKLWR